jgi:hypothetical protein
VPRLLELLALRGNSRPGLRCRSRPSRTSQGWYSSKARAARGRWPPPMPLARMQPPRRLGPDGGAADRTVEQPTDSADAGTPDPSTRTNNTSSGKAVMEIAKKQKLKLREEQRRLALEADGEGNAQTAPPATPTRTRIPQPSPKPSPSSGLGAVLNGAATAAAAPHALARRCSCVNISSLPHVRSSQTCRCRSGRERSRQQRFRIDVSGSCE